MTLRISAFFLALLLVQPAYGAGLFLTDRGVRPLGRGGAFIAGADDLHSLSYNPAGLSEAGTQLLVDAAYLNVTTTFLRRTYFPTSSQGMPITQTAPQSVTGYAPFLPIPTIAVSHNFGLKTWNFAASLDVPYAALLEYPATIVDPKTNIETAAPQRYSTISSQGTVLGVLSLMASKTFLDGKLAIGLGPKFLLGTYSSTLALSGCPGVFCAEQDPKYDTVTQLKTGLIFAPSLAFGARYSINDTWRVGFSGQLPFWVDAPAQVNVRLPDAALFNNASVQGNEARLRFQTPLILRAGVEMRPIKGLRVELAVVFEGWSIHKEIDVLRSGKGTNLLNVNLLPSPYPINDLTIARNFRDTFSVRAGVEYEGGTKALGYRVRGGLSYDRSAIPNEYLSALTVDLDKITPSVGASLLFGNWSFDVVYAHVFGIPTTVDPTRAKLYAVSPVRQEPIQQTAINGGDYTLQANVLGIGLTYRFQ